ncbi:MAG: hypothetical protein J5929_09570 [Eubacterium sp.]|nr:hypothetical protein [Eubacterium sp.]
MTGNPEAIVKWLFSQDRDKLFDIDVHREKRSNDANRYAWKLCTMIADAIRSSKEEVYVKMLKRYGQSTLIGIREDVCPEGFFKYFEIQSNVNGYNYIIVYKGSSEYDSREMSVLIDGIVSEAKEMGIETIPPDELKRLKESWKK